MGRMEEDRDMDELSNRNKEEEVASEEDREV